MGHITGNGFHISGNFSKLGRRKPKDWANKDYKILTKYPFKWRDKIGKVKCTCKEVEEHYQMWYGWTWYHTEECALMQLVNKRPQLLNLWCYQHLPEITSSDASEI